jgi:hypothetical protein
VVFLSPRQILGQYPPVAYDCFLHFSFQHFV